MFEGLNEYFAGQRYLWYFVVSKFEKCELPLLFESLVDVEFDFSVDDFQMQTGRLPI